MVLCSQLSGQPMWNPPWFASEHSSEINLERKKIMSSFCRGLACYKEYIRKMPCFMMFTFSNSIWFNVLFYQLQERTGQSLALLSTQCTGVNSVTVLTQCCTKMDWSTKCQCSALCSESSGKKKMSPLVLHYPSYFFSEVNSTVSVIAWSEISYFNPVNPFVWHQFLIKHVTSIICCHLSQKTLKS